MEKFNESLPFDKRMWAEDIRVGGVQDERLGYLGSQGGGRGAKVLQSGWVPANPSSDVAAAWRSLSTSGG
jgi:hypothetical protein